MKTTNFSIPKHDAVKLLTKEEAEKLAKHWDLDMQFKTPKS